MSGFSPGSERRFWARREVGSLRRSERLSQKRRAEAFGTQQGSRRGEGRSDADHVKRERKRGRRRISSLSSRRPRRRCEGESSEHEAPRGPSAMRADAPSAEARVCLYGADAPRAEASPRRSVATMGGDGGNCRTCGRARYIAARAWAGSPRRRRRAWARAEAPPPASAACAPISPPP